MGDTPAIGSCVAGALVVDSCVTGAFVSSGVVGAEVGFVVGDVGAAVLGSGVDGAVVRGTGAGDAHATGSGVAGSTVISGTRAGDAPAIGSGVAGVRVLVLGSGVGSVVTGAGLGDAPRLSSGVADGVPPMALVRYITSATTPMTTRIANKQFPTIHARNIGRSCHFFASSAPGVKASAYMVSPSSSWSCTA